MKRKIVVLAVALTFLMLQTMIQLNPSMFIVQAVFGPEDIVFEYGAEAGNIGDVPKPPFDQAGPSGSGSHEVSYVKIDDGQVRTSDKSLKFYQPASPKSDAQARVELRLADTQKEFWLSWWVYVPSGCEWENRIAGEWGPVLGGWQTFFGPSGSVWYYWTGGRVSINDVHVGGGTFERRLKFTYEWGPSSDSFAGQTSDSYTTSYLIGDYLNQWLHFQVYIKWSNSSDGKQEWYFNNNAIWNKTGMNNDPTGFSEWTSEGCVFALGQPYPYLNIELYQSRGELSPERWCWVDDIVISDEKVSESYGVDYPSGVERWENWFAEGDFSAWNGTDGNAPVIISSDAYRETYSANFTALGGDNSYSRVKKTFQEVNEVYIRSRVKFKQLPDSDTTLWGFRVADSSDNYLAVCGIINSSVSGYGWRVATIVGQTENYTATDPTVDDWHNIEFYVKGGANANITVWVNGTKVIERTGDDLSGRGAVSRIQVQCYCMDAQGGARTFLHDDVVVDNAYIGTGSYALFEGDAWYGVEGQYSPLPDVLVNGSATDSSGRFKIINLDYNTIYTFVVEAPASYYPAWCLYVNNGFHWNGSHYILSHNVTEQALIQLYFVTETTHPYVNYTDAELTSGAFSTYLFDLVAEKDSGLTTTEIDVDGGGNATYVYNVDAWQYDVGNDIIQVNITHSSAVAFETSWGFMATHTLEVLNTNYTDGGTYPYLTSSEGIITNVTSTLTQLTFTVRGTGATRTDVYTRNLPLLNVTGAETYIHDETNDILQIYVSHSSDENVTVAWGYAAPPLFEWPDFATLLAGFNTAIYIYPVMIVGMVTIGLVMLYYGRADAYEYVRSAPWLLVVAAIGIIGVFVYYFIISAIMGVFV